MSKLSERILTAISRTGLSYNELSRRCGISKSALQRYATGETENIPVDKVEAIAAATNVSAISLLGWELQDDEWMCKFRETLAEELAHVDASDAEAAGINLERLYAILDGEKSISLSDACSIADELGVSLDYMVGRNKIELLDSVPTTTLDERLALFNQLPPEKQEQVLEYMEFLIATSKKE